MKTFNLRFRISLILVVALGVILMWYFETGCLIQRFLGFPCPTCGMTRAAFAFINGDFYASFEYHPMLFSIPLLTVMLMLYEKLFRGKFRIPSLCLLALILCGFIVNYIIKLISLGGI
ncbi:MAG: DUF2752 domain-containing protein [Oscillospiraceae bacterium]|nr:DUF2752 domain-containing protein [Oscillospiraceae bacterium]